MSRFIQLHLLTFYPPSNLNRDDVGRPKTAFMGGVERLRISSQALKRAIRTSEVFALALDGHLASRTQRFAETIIEPYLRDKGANPEQANDIARQIAAVFGKVATVDADHKKKGDRALLPSARTAQLAFIGREEQKAALDLAEKMLADPTIRVKPELVLTRADSAVDIAMFGRMLADNPDFNREAAVQVAHAVTTHRVVIEDDFYTAVDDLKQKGEDAGAGFMGETGFGSGIFYLYVCVDSDLLVGNLAENADLAKLALKSLVEALATVSPTGKQASFASRARASYILAEIGGQQPRTLAGAFAQAIKGENIIDDSIMALVSTCEQMDKVYGPCAESRKAMNALEGEGSLADIQSFVTTW
jgi:CRISPR system Cascade subunit CasC